MGTNKSESANAIDRVRRRVAAIQGLREDKPASLFAVGHAGIDDVLGGGLARGRMHEICAGGPEEASSAAAFAALLALRAGAPGTTMMWLRTGDAERRSGRMHGPGLAELGLDPASMVMAVVPDDVALLRSAADAAACAGLGAIVVECWRNPAALDLTAGRRLVLAAERSGVTLLMLRIDAAPAATACDTRWRVSAAPSQALAANAPGHPAFDIELLRRRAGPAGMVWRLEWNRDDRIFQNQGQDLGGPAIPGAVVSLPLRGPAAYPASGPVRRAG